MTQRNRSHIVPPSVDVQSFEIQGHRGARWLFPENTLQGFQAARDMGVAIFELDVGLTRDGVVVVSHDPALNPDITRDADGRWLDGPGPLIRHLTLAELGQYDVGRIRPGTRYANSFPDQVPIDGARIPTLLDVLRMDDRTRFTIEIKTDPTHPDHTADPVTLADAVLAVIDQADAAGRMMIESFDWRGPRHIRAVRPAMPTAWLTSQTTEAASGLWWGGRNLADHGGSVPLAVAAEGGTAWAPQYLTVTQAGVAEAHALGLCVLPWTVNQPSDIQRLIQWGVDGLITDRPDLALRILKQVDTV
jgi:glycerophosphoryl diester phosphodiesterase